MSGTPRVIRCIFLTFPWQLPLVLLLELLGMQWKMTEISLGPLLLEAFGSLTLTSPLLSLSLTVCPAVLFFH